VTDINIPDDVKRLILEHIDSVEQLDILLLLYNIAARSDFERSPAAVSKELCIDINSAAERLADLCARGFLAVKNKTETLYYFSPATTDLDRATGGLATSYKNHKYAIIKLIFSKPTDKIRTFADTFKIKKDES
jgi:hypothetical protein